MEARNPLSVEDVFDDFNGRRAALIKALTDDQDKVFEKCDPEKENLCLYGYPNGSWEVNLPVEEVPPELPEPVLGINYSRDGLSKKDWRSLVATHSDSWLLSVAFYFGARFGFGKNERMRLFEMINELPTIYEAVNAEDKPPKDQPINQNSSKSKSSKKPRQCEQPTEKMSALAKEEKSEEEGEDEQSETLCGACGEKYATGEFWICCDACERWFHGKCVKITPAKAEHIKQYKCPSCSNNKRARVFSS